MNKLTVAAKTLALTIAASTFAFAALADGAPKFLGNTTSCETTLGVIPEDFDTYWNQITPQMECTRGEVEKVRGEYDWSVCDIVYNWAKEHKALFMFRTLLWGGHNPAWLAGLDSAETRQSVIDWFDAVAKRYPDLEMIEVVTEAVRNGQSYHSGFPNYKFIEALGGDTGNYEFVVTAFKMARERWPRAILIYNDYNTIQWNKDLAIDLVKKIKAQGAPVDGFGMQFHDMLRQGSGTFCVHSFEIESALRDAYEQTGVPIYVTQYDIGVYKDSLQKACYQEHIPVLMETDYVKGVTLWGYIYGKTWVTCADSPTKNGCSGIIKDGIDRPAMTWLKEYFAENYPYTPLGPEEPSAIAQNLYFSPNTLQKFEVFNARGVRLGVFTAHSFESAVQMLKNSNALNPSGVYYLRNRATGAVRPVRLSGHLF